MYEYYPEYVFLLYLFSQEIPGYHQRAYLTTVVIFSFNNKRHKKKKGNARKEQKDLNSKF